MKLNVFVNGRAVATLQSHDNFEHDLTYLESAGPQDRVSLQMPVRTQGWRWPALHPVFQMNWPDEFLLSVLKDQLGPRLGAGAMNLLAVVGHQLPGRVCVASSDTTPARLVLPSLRSLLRGRASQEVFLNLLSQSVALGLPGQTSKSWSPETKLLFRKGSVYTERHIVKASSARQPFLALNEHLCLQACAATGYKTAKTQVAEDGQTLLVDRCDINAENGQYQGYEDFCSLLGLPPENRYDSSWERQARLVRDYIVPARLRQANEQLAVTLMLSLVLGNSALHSKRLALVYNHAEDVQLAPISDMLSTLAYERHAAKPPGLYLDGMKNWDPGASLWRFLQQHLGLENPRQRELADLVCTSVSEQVPTLLHHINHTPGFAQLGRSMLSQWGDGVKRLHARLTVPLPDFPPLATSTDSAQQDPLTATDTGAGQTMPSAKPGRKRRAGSSRSVQPDAAQLKLLFE